MTFDSMGLRPSLLAALAEQGITDPSPIQRDAIPQVMAGRDVMGLAQTGTGKTAAFGLPIADALLGEADRCAEKTAKALILAPTRELAGQIHDTLVSYTKGAHLRVGLVVGGKSISAQATKLKRGVHLLVATPGRLIDLIERKAVRLDDTRFLVLDEADQMLDLGFIHALRQIARLLPAKRQTLLFSATMPKQMAELSRTYLNDPIRIEVAPPGKPADKVDQSVHFVEQSNKTSLLVNLLDKHRDELSLVFTRTKHGADRLTKALTTKGFSVGAIHGNKSQGQRDRALKAFRDGELRVLVATDVAARGLDIPGVRFVYNFDLPNVATNYVHRIGRTARAGRDGTAVALCAPEDHGELKTIEKLMGKPIPVASGTRPVGMHADAKGKGKGKPMRRGGGGGGASRRPRGRGQGQRSAA